MEPQVNVDYLIKNGFSGEVATYMKNHQKLDPALLRPYFLDDGKPYITVFKGGDAKKPENYQAVPAFNVNTVLRKDEWKQLDDAVIPIAESRLVGIRDLEANNLIYSLNNPMATTVLESENVSDAMEAAVTMDGVTRSPGDRMEYGITGIPIPIIHVDFEINQRVLEASRMRGNPLDTTSAERAARKVAEKLENMLFTNTTYTFGGYSIKSYINYGDREKVTMSTAWTSITASSTESIGKQILDDVLAMKQASINAYHYGPWIIYIPTAYETLMDEDYDPTDSAAGTIRDRIKKVGGINDIKVADTLSGNNVVMVQMTRDVVRLVRGMSLQTVQWETEGKFVNKFKVLTIQVPQIRSDNNGKTGIVHLATA